MDTSIDVSGFTALLIALGVAVGTAYWAKTSPHMRKCRRVATVARQASAHRLSHAVTTSDMEDGTRPAMKRRPRHTRVALPTEEGSVGGVGTGGQI